MNNNLGQTSETRNHELSNTILSNHAYDNHPTRCYKVEDIVLEPSAEDAAVAHITSTFSSWLSHGPEIVLNTYSNEEELVENEADPDDCSTGKILQVLLSHSIDPH